MRQLEDHSSQGELDPDYLFGLFKDKCFDKVQGTVGGVELDVIIDSGASCHIIDRPCWEMLKSKLVTCNCYFADKKIYSYGTDEPLKLAAAFQAEVSIPSRTIS